MDSNTHAVLAGEQACIQLARGEPLSEPFITETGSYKQGKKTPYSSGAPLKGGGIKLGLLCVFVLIHHSRHKAGTEEDAGEIN